MNDSYASNSHCERRLAIWYPLCDHLDVRSASKSSEGEKTASTHRGFFYQVTLLEVGDGDSDDAGGEPLCLAGLSAITLARRSRNFLVKLSACDRPLIIKTSHI